MSKLVLDKDKKKAKNYLKDVMFAYVKLQKPVFQFESKTDFEYILDVVVDEDTADAFEDCVVKSSVRKVKTAVFEDKFGVKPPYPEAKNQYILKIRAYSHYSSGEEVPYKYTARPKVLVPDGAKVKDVTMDLLVGNGSRGDLSFSIQASEYGSSAKVTAILVTDMIIYESNEGESAFGTIANADEAIAKAEATQAVAPVRSSDPVAEEVGGDEPVSEPTYDPEDDSVPF